MSTLGRVGTLEDDAVAVARALVAHRAAGRRRVATHTPAGLLDYMGEVQRTHRLMLDAVERFEETHPTSPPAEDPAP
jgi:hypothetical protein